MISHPYLFMTHISKTTRQKEMKRGNWSSMAGSKVPLTGMSYIIMGPCEGPYRTTDLFRFRYIYHIYGSSCFSHRHMGLLWFIACYCLFSKIGNMHLPTTRFGIGGKGIHHYCSNSLYGTYDNRTSCRLDHRFKCLESGIQQQNTKISQWSQDSQW